ncbi:MAG: NAD-dependent epimerase/dehydratase family protein [Chlamydiae bacterium]|nr:NAD-dependent epimerase/dehydratase family protein [Chlamydiota bacterium]
MKYLLINFILASQSLIASMDPVPKAETRFLVFGGKTGWIGKMVIETLEKEGIYYDAAESRLEEREHILKEIEKKKPTHIINTAGVTGVPNVDWCETNRQQTLRSNIIGALNLADIAYLKGIHMTNFGTGCIYEYDAQHPLGSNIGFTEQEAPNFFGSFYSSTKVQLDQLLKNYPNVLNLRLRMPISSDLSSRNFITKITKYKKVINVPNSMTVLDEMIPIAIELALSKETGNYNFTNPGVVSHNEILQLYKTYVDPDFTWENFTVEEQDQILKAKRSNNELDVSKLKEKFPELKEIHESLLAVFEKIRSLKNT